MKKRLLLSVLLFAFVFLGMQKYNVQAADGTYQGKGFTLDYTIDGANVTIKHYDGDTSTTAIVIPSKIAGCTVTKIGSKAFEYENFLQSIKIPDTVTYIGDKAFIGCYHLHSIAIPKSVTYIGKYAVGYHYSEEDHKYYFNCMNFTIYGTYGTQAASYAKNNEMKFVDKSHVKHSWKLTSEYKKCNKTYHYREYECIYCGKSKWTKKEKHSFSFDMIIKKATPSSKGKVQYKCKKCDFEIIRTYKKSKKTDSLYVEKDAYKNKYQKTIFNTGIFFDYNKYQSKKYKTNVIIEWNDAKYRNVKQWLIKNGIKSSKANAIRKVRFQIKLKGKWIKSQYINVHLNKDTVGFGYNGQFLLKQRLVHNKVYPLKAQFVNSKNKVLYTEKFYSYVPTAIKYSSFSVKKVGENALKISWPRGKKIKGYEINMDEDNKVITTYHNYYTFKPVKGEKYYHVEIQAFSKYGPANSGGIVSFMVDLDNGKILPD